MLSRPEFRTFLPTLVWLLALLGGLDQAALGSGCDYSAHHSTLETAPGGQFVENGLWTTGPVQRVYEDGQFFYYRVYTAESGSSLPCHGPNCGGTPSTETVGVSSTSTNSRLSDWITPSNLPFYRSSSSSSSTALYSAVPCCPFLEGPLRPPRGI